jgi:hypothetical protein
MGASEATIHFFLETVMTVKTIADAIDFVEDDRRARHDYELPLEKVSLSLNSDQDSIVVCIDGVDYEPTDYCLRQCMATKFGVPIAAVNHLTRPSLKQNGEVRFERDAVDLQLLVHLFQNQRRDDRIDPKKVYRFRTYTDGTLRAMLTDKYAIIDNVWYLEQLAKVFDEIGGDEPYFVHWGGNADNIYGNLRIPSSERYGSGMDSEYGGMINITNSEIGDGKISLAPSVWRQICTNGMMGWAADKANQWGRVHRGSIDLGGLASEIKVKIHNQLKVLDRGIDTLLATQDKPFSTDATRLIAQTAIENNLTPGEKGQARDVLKQYADHESSFRNLFGIVNAVTRAAQNYDVREQFRMEAIGGKLAGYSEDDWTRFNNRAMNMDDKARDKVYGIVTA